MPELQNPKGDPVHLDGLDLPGASPEVNRFPVQPYRWKCGVPFIGTMLLFCSLSVGGALVGFIAFVLYRWRAFGLTAMFEGLALALCGFAAVRIVKVRSPWAAMLAGIWGACLTMLTLYFCLYVQALNRISGDREIRPSVAGFIQYMDGWARRGVSVLVDSSPERHHATLGYAGSYLLWLVDLAAMAGIAAVLLFLIARRPYCPRCNSWKKKNVLGYLTGPGKELSKILKDGRVASLTGRHPDLRNGNHRLSLYACSTCGQGQVIDLYLEQVRDRQGNPRGAEIAMLTYPGEAMPIVEGLFRPANE
jgi:hypothetical protein